MGPVAAPMNRLKPKDLPAYREAKLKEQNGIDPITGLQIENPCLDHDHVSGRCRMVLERETNAWEGKVFNAWRRYLRHKGVPLIYALVKLAQYHTQDFSQNAIHPKHRTQDEKRERRNKRARLKRKKAK